MAWSVGRATWVGDVTDPDIAQQVGSRTFDRGEAYAAERRVRSLASRADGLMLLATVDGSRSSTYQTIVEAREHPRGRSHLWSGRCSCPVAVDCKHVVALLLVARDVAHGITPDGGSPTPDAPAPAPAHWADVLGHVRPRAAPTEPEAPVRPEAQGDLVPAGLYVDTVYRSPSGWGGVPELGYGLRPTRLTRAGTWHRKLSWQEALPRWRAGLRYLPEHEEIMAALRDAARPGSGGVTSSLGSPTLALEASPEVWAHLSRAQEAGIELLPGEGVSGPVTVLADAARLVLRVLRATDESGDLSVRVGIEGLPDDLAGERLLIGDPVHGLAFEDEEGALTFLPLEQDLELGREALLRAEAGLRVPADERARFLRTAVPGLRQRVRVRSEVPLPVPDDAAGGPGAGGASAGPRPSPSSSPSALTCPGRCASSSATPTTAGPAPSARRGSPERAPGTAPRRRRPSPRPRRCWTSRARPGPTSPARATSSPLSCCAASTRPGSSPTCCRPSRPTTTSRSSSTATCPPSRR